MYMYEKERLLKNYLMAAIIVILVLAAVLGYTRIELGKYRHIEGGDYITTDACRDWCADENGIAFTGEEDGNIEGIGVLINIT